MALTLVEAAKLSNDVLQQGIIEKIVYNDPILQRMPFVNITGNGLTYNVEKTMSGAAFYQVGDTWDESSSEVDQHTAVLRIMGGDADVDNFLKATRSNVNDLMQEQIDAKIKALRDLFHLCTWYGYNTGQPKYFDGLHYLIRSSTAPYNNVVAVATASGTALALSLERLEKGIDLCKDGADLIVMSKLMRRSINKYLKGVGGITSAEVQGKMVQTIGDVPLAVDDRISDDESCDLQYGTNESAAAVYGHNYADGTALGDDDNATSIFVLKFAPYAFCGCQTEAPKPEIIGPLENKDAERVRVKWYASIMLQKIITCSKVTGVAPAGTVTA
jgi:Ca2+-binding RTX toxin-like protein